MAITDLENTEAWLKVQPREVQAVFAARCALRGLPAIRRANDRTVRQIALPLLRAILSSGVAGTCPTPEVIRSAAAAAANSYTRSGSASATYATRSASSAARLIGFDAAASAFFATRFAASDAAASQVLCATDYDAAAISNVDGDPASVFLTPLWPGGAFPKKLARLYDKLRAFWQKDASVWDFWQTWYEDMLAGRPVDWDFLRQVVLLPDEDWKRGAAHIARLIEKLRAKRDLQGSIEDLEQDLTGTASSRLGLGGNNPPEPLDQDSQLPAGLLIVWAPLQELKEEAEKQAPDPARLRKATDALILALAEIATWCRRKLDRATDKAIDWGVPAGLGYLVLHQDKIRAVIEAAEAFLKLP
ncbi:hypothetical protein [Rhodovulum visakhapatnamense]|uniref:Uncharacterized protein n=1 Tax=Rhodovulum visakhapatnamense TaxID=364297 RepID=A0A4R8FPC4_9RHOB|nr:hypothetical protein [Rhodovulum visakhapatnamense]TDX28294.1 hypothetical protein EV657_112122 [Rhodovulum visakhapatnamense]